MQIRLVLTTKIVLKSSQKPELGWSLVGTLSNNVWTPHPPSNMDAITKSKTFNKWPEKKESTEVWCCSNFLKKKFKRSNWKAGEWLQAPGIL